MLRTELVDAVNELTTALKTTELEEILQLALSGRREQGKISQIYPRLLNALKEYSISAHRFSPTAQHLTHIFDLNILKDVTAWAKVALANDAASTNILFTMLHNVSFALRYLPRIATLFAINSQYQQPEQKLEVLSIVLTEDEGSISTVERVITAFQSLQSLYDACSIVCGIQAEKLSLAACDSGSDKTFELIGTTEVIRCLKELTLDIFNQVLYYKQKNIPISQDLVVANLAILGKASGLERNGAMSPEQAELLRRQLLSGVNGLLSAGVLTPEMQQQAIQNARKLLTPSPKLLTAATIADETQEDIVEGVATHESLPEEQMPPATS